MAKKISGAKTSDVPRSREREQVAQPGEGRAAHPSSRLDTRVVYCGGPCRTGQFWGLPREITSRATHPRCLRRISRGETKEKRAFEDRHENTKAYIDFPPN